MSVIQDLRVDITADTTKLEDSLVRARALADVLAESLDRTAPLLLIRPRRPMCREAEENLRRSAAAVAPGIKLLVIGHDLDVFQCVDGCFSPVGSNADAEDR
jgi:hypothetical protein